MRSSGVAQKRERFVCRERNGIFQRGRQMFGMQFVHEAQEPCLLEPAAGTHRLHHILHAEKGRHVPPRPGLRHPKPGAQHVRERMLVRRAARGIEGHRVLRGQRAREMGVERGVARANRHGEPGLRHLGETRDSTRRLLLGNGEDVQ